MSGTKRAFTLIELLAVIAIIGLLVGLVLPSLSRARLQGRSVVCLAHLGEFAKGWQMYADDNESIILPARMYDKPGGKTNRENWYDVGNGKKYRPRWPAIIGVYVGVPAFNEPLTKDKDGIRADWQDYDNELYSCPTEGTWINERNFAYGYNYQFLGNARQTNDTYHRFPVAMHRIKAPSKTVVFGDCLGTAAGYRASSRSSYNRLGTSFTSMGNHGFTLDPPRLTEDSDRGSGSADSTRTAVAARHQEKANVVFADGHGEGMPPRELGYRTNRFGRFVDHDPADESEPSPGEDPATGVADAGDWFTGRAKTCSVLAELDPDDEVEDGAHNRLFSGTGRDEDPPEIPQYVEE